MSIEEQLHTEANGAGDREPPAPEPPLSAVAQAVRDHIADFENQLAELKDQRATLVQEHEQKLAAIDSDIVICQNAIAGLTGKPAPKLKEFRRKKPQPRRVGRVTGAGTATGFGVSLEACLVASRAIKQMVAERIERGEPEAFTQKEFYRYPDLDWDQSKGSQAIRYMRHVSFLRKAGRSNDTGAELWKIMDADAVEKAVEQAEKATDEYERQVIAAAGVEPGDRVVECLREVGGSVEGASELARLTGIPKGSISEIMKSLETTHTISVERRGPGKSTVIRLTQEEATEA